MVSLSGGPHPRNLLILMVDEMTFWALDEGVQTPNLDALAARGTSFTAAYTPSPICVPARAAMATGKYVHEIAHWSSAEAYDGRVRSWAHDLRDAGVDVVSIGKLHYRNATDDTGFGRQIHPLHIPGGEGWVRGLLRKPLCDYAPTEEMARDIGPGDTAYHSFDRQVTDAACTWLGQRDATPWCAFVSWLSPHYPLIAPAGDYARYDPADYVTEAEAVPDHPILRQVAEFFDHDPHFTPRTRGIAHAAYRGLCTFVDRQIGLVLDALTASGQADDTLILFTSDHGDMMGQHGFWAKSVMYDASARVPLILAGPGISAGRCDDPVSLIDIAPTAARVFGTPAAAFSGRALQDPPDPDRAVLSEYHDGGASVGITMLRWTDPDGAWKYIHYAEGHPPQLFDLRSDPEERTDLAALQPQRVTSAAARLSARLDPEAVNATAHADQARRIQAMGGRAALLARTQWNYTPAPAPGQ